MFYKGGIEMKKLYTIGETSKIVGISTQMLRKYSNAELVKPQIIKEETGYRYYSFEQFHVLDRIKYLRTLGMSLKDIKDIKDIMQTGNLSILMKQLDKRKNILKKELNKLQNEIDDIQWYQEYFSYLNRIRLPGIPYVRHFHERYILVIDYDENNKLNETDIIAQVETKIIRLKNSHNYQYRRQWGYVVDMEKYIQNKFNPKRYFIFLKEKPECWDDTCMATIPAGLYLCLWCEKKDDIHAELIRSFYQNKKIPLYALALEYENSLIAYKTCPYEYQCLIQHN